MEAENLKIEKECLLCLKNQCHQAIKLVSGSQNILTKVSDSTESLLSSEVDFNSPPPKIAIDVYEKIASITGNKDIYASIKTECIQKARSIANTLLENKPFFENPKDELKWAIQMAALGNIIDYGSATKFNIHNETFDTSKLDFAFFDLEAFSKKLENAKTLLYFADNAGENIFDEILISSIKSIYPHINITYLTRGNPIINDITLDDLILHKECEKIFQLCNVQSSGVRSPGFIYKMANIETQHLFDNADVMIAKGMGNFECMEDIPDDRIFLLFKIKCNVVSRHLNIELGKMIFKQNKKN